MRLKESPSQTAGPYVHIGCTPRATGLEFGDHDLGAALVTSTVEGKVEGTAITITGSVFDGAGDPLLDAMVEIWQADANGTFNTAGFTGWGRTAGDMDTGAFIFDTIKPGRVAMADGTLQAPHVTFWIVARGINLGLQTRMYFADEGAANATDPLLNALPDPARATTLLAQPAGDNTYRFDIHLQGDAETVFLDI